MSLKRADHGIIIASLLLTATAPSLARELDTVGAFEVFSQDAADQSSEAAWRCSIDGKYYSLTLSGGLHVRALRSGMIVADLPLKTDKKGHNSLEGQWRAGNESGLLVIERVEPDFIGGRMLVPVPGAPVAACNSRKASVIYSIGQPQPVCKVVAVSWDRTRNVSTEQAANQESVADLVAAYNAAQAQPQSSAGGADPSVDGSLVGVWSNESATAVSYMKTRLVLRADGTYTKTFGARPPTMGGGVVGAPTWGDTHTGTWSVVGPMVIRLSGDAQHTPYRQDLSQLRKE